MKKIYCIFYDYTGYEAGLESIYENKEDAIKWLVAESRKQEYRNVIDYMQAYEYSLVEWECGTQNTQLIVPSLEWEKLI